MENVEGIYQKNNPLAQPIKINGLQIKNRLVKSATQENMVDKKGIITQDYIDYYNVLSAGGVGLIITGHFYVNIHGRNNIGMAGADLDEQIPKLRQMTDIVHKNNTAIFAQLNHAGLKAVPENGIDKRVLAPSKSLWASAMTLEEIHETVENFGQAAARIKKARFDGIEIHAAHSYLIGQFLSKRMNRRKDKYGGSLSNRQRFCLEVYDSIRENVGKDFPVIIKLDSYSRSYASTPPLIKLITPKEALDTAKKLEDAGIDAIEVSCGLNATKGAMPYKLSITSSLRANGQNKTAYIAGFLLTPFDLVLNQTIWFQPHHNMKYIKLFKQKLNIPVLAGSCFRDPNYMKQVIKNQEADMICFARPLVYNPNFPNEILEGSDKQSGCINCNLCLFLLPSGKPLKCYFGKPPK